MKLFALWAILLAMFTLNGCRSKQEDPLPSPSPEPLNALEATPFYYPEEGTPYSTWDTPAGAPSLEDGATDAADAQKTTGSGTSTASASAASTWTPTYEEMHQSLNDYGSWSTVQNYGQVWVPRTTTTNWMPYQSGHWVNTQYGWLWEGAEPWGWLPYHYGHWVFVPRVGWAWVPGRTWIPAQVAWRTGDNYVAWAPYPPGRATISSIPPAAWIVVPTARFLERTLTPYFLPPARVTAILPRTRVIAATRPVGRTAVYHVGPSVTVVKTWVPRVPAPISVSTWRARTPTLYAAHYTRGVAQGWYRYPPPPAARQGVHVQTGTVRRGTEVDVDRKPGQGRSVEVEHHSPRNSVEVEVDHRGRHSEVDIDRRGPRKDINVERKGRKVDVDVDR